MLPESDSSRDADLSPRTTDASESRSGDSRTCETDLTPGNVWSSQQLLGGQREAIIMHDGQAYRLLCTRNGKLILQK